MKLNSLKLNIENFQKITKANLEFSGLTIIKGDSSLGKSSIRRAIESVVYGGFKNENDESSGYVKLGAKESVINLEFDNNIVAITKSKTKNSYQVNGIELPKGGRGVPEEVQKLGYTPLNNNLSLNIAKQHSPLFIVGESEADITKNLNSVFKVQLFEVAISKILKYKRESETKETILLEAVTRVSKEVEELKALETLLTETIANETMLTMIEQHQVNVQEVVEITSVKEVLVSILRDTSNIIMIGDYLQSNRDYTYIKEAIDTLKQLVLEIDQYTLIDEHLYNEEIVKGAKDTIEVIKTIQHDLEAYEALISFQEDKVILNELKDDIEQSRVSLLEITNELSKYTCKSCKQVIYSDGHKH